jgi:hypothetical protein
VCCGSRSSNVYSYYYYYCYYYYFEQVVANNVAGLVVHAMRDLEKELEMWHSSNKNNESALSGSEDVEEDDDENDYSCSSPDLLAAANMGSAEAQLVLAQRCDDFVERFELLSKAAASGLEEAQLQVAFCFLRGEGERMVKLGD